MKVFIVNVGEGNYLWPECLRRNTIAIIDSEGAHRLWETGDRDAYIAYAVEKLKTVRGEVPTRQLASRWYSLNDEITQTEGDIWFHREKDQLWWTTSRLGAVEKELKPSKNRHRDGANVFELHKPCGPWSDRTRRGAPLSWNGLHPKAKDFLFTESTLQRLNPDNAAYVLALLNGDDPSPWHNRADWIAKVERTGRNPAVRFDAIERAVWRMADTVEATVAQANGQRVLRTLKCKECAFTKEELRAYIDGLVKDQDGLCALTGIRLQFDGDHDNVNMLCSLDRIDSDKHYEPGNLQVVCRFVNKWKSDTPDPAFRQLLDEVRAVRSV